MTTESALWAARVRRVLSADTDDFCELLELAGLDPGKDLRFQDFSGCDFSGANLRGYDFTGARLHGCRFEGALIDGARFDQAEINGTNLRVAKDWERHRGSWVKQSPVPPSGHLPVGAVFQDAPFAPEMVVIPRGRFWMGSKKGEGEKDEWPRHEVTIPRALAVGRFPLTVDEWHFAESPKDWMRKRGKVEGKLSRAAEWAAEPATEVSWEDAQAYVRWLSRKTDQPYRLLSEAEWEYACRAGSEAAYCFGDSAHELAAYAWFADILGEKATGWRKEAQRFWASRHAWQCVGMVRRRLAQELCGQTRGVERDRRALDSRR